MLSDSFAGLDVHISVFRKFISDTLKKDGELNCNKLSRGNKSSGMIASCVLTD